MSAGLGAIIKEAMQLDPIDRAELLNRLFLSFSPVQNARIEAKWQQEVEDRITAYDNGDISAEDADEVFKRLAKR
ncbi:MAG: addiction module protein [Candidatus Riflebacteria bacterium HGW-Riflebacteria-1]|jgi:putative addiction module component (TIGR02574 family)|nr:MAG: addiction module protein [Candidatus Riflebacteria bacterium HGW-Riflebacteria-1]